MQFDMTINIKIDYLEPFLSNDGTLDFASKMGHHETVCGSIDDIPAE
jgi:hypothetical protein